MSLLFRAPERRAISIHDDWSSFGGTKTASGERVTADKALRVDAMWSAVTLLASTVANLPVDVFRGTGGNKRPVEPQPPLVAGPSLIVSRREWVYQAMVSMLLRGNAYGLVLERDSNQRATVVEWLDPDAVTVKQKSALKRPTYELDNAPVPKDDMVHLRAFVRPGSAVGMSPVEYRAETLGISLAARSYGAKFYADGGHPTAVFQNKAKPDVSEQAATIKDRFLAIVRGKREPLVIGSDWSYEAIQVSPQEAAFVSAMGYSDAQIARMYGPGLAEVLGYTESGSSLTYSNRVDRSLDLLTYTVLPWIGKFEDFWTGAIAKPQTARMNVNALLRADAKTQREMFQIDRAIGLHSIDEIRALIDEPPLPDGQGQDYTPLKTGGGETKPQEDSE